MTTPTYYAVKAGYNAADNTLTAVTPPPRMIETVHAEETNFYGSSASQFNGLVSTVLEWNIISAAERASLLTQFGVSATVASNQVTETLNTNRTGTWTRYNCISNYDASERPVQLGFSGFKLTLTWIEASS